MFEGARKLAAVEEVGGFGAAERVSVWTRPAARAPQPFTAWHDALRAAFVVPQDEMDLPPELLDEGGAADPADEAFQLGYAEGLAAGRAEADAERAALRNLARSLDTLKPEPTRALGAMIAATVERLVSEIVGAVEVDRATLLARAEAAAALVGEETRPAVLKLHPADLARLADAELPVAVEGDATLALGALRLETAGGWIEDGIELRLAKLRAMLAQTAAAR